MRESVGLTVAILLLAGCQTAPGRGGDAVAPIGAQARTQRGPEAVTKPPEDVGSAEDPTPPPKP